MKSRLDAEIWELVSRLAAEFMPASSLGTRLASKLTELHHYTFLSDGCRDMTVRKVPEKMLGKFQDGRILHGSSMEQYCYERLHVGYACGSPM